MVQSVHEGSLAARAGLVEGMVIRSINGKVTPLITFVLLTLVQSTNRQSHTAILGILSDLPVTAGFVINLVFTL